MSVRGGKPRVWLRWRYCGEIAADSCHHLLQEAVKIKEVGSAGEGERELRRRVKEFQASLVFWSKEKGDFVWYSFRFSGSLGPFSLSCYVLGPLCAESLGRPEDPEKEGGSGWSWMQQKLPACASKEVIHAVLYNATWVPVRTWWTHPKHIMTAGNISIDVPKCKIGNINQVGQITWYPEKKLYTLEKHITRIHTQNGSGLKQKCYHYSPRNTENTRR